LGGSAGEGEKVPHVDSGDLGKKREGGRIKKVPQKKTEHRLLRPRMELSAPIKGPDRSAARGTGAGGGNRLALGVLSEEGRSPALNADIGQQHKTLGEGGGRGEESLCWRGRQESSGIIRHNKRAGGRGGGGDKAPSW